MRRWLPPLVITVSIGLVGGAWWMRAAQDPFRDVKSSALNLEETPRHPVTPEMERTAESYVGEPLPEFQLPDSEGRVFQSKQSNGDSRPRVIIMTKDGCPCSMEAQINWNRLALHYGDSAEFIAIMDADRKGAREFQLAFGVPYRILCSTNDQVFRLFGAKQSVFTYFVDQGGVIRAVWPGYNQGSLEELNDLLSRATGKKPWDIKQAMAPQSMTSGCFFFRPVGTEEPAW